MNPGLLYGKKVELTARCGSRVSEFQRTSRLAALAQIRESVKLHPAMTAVPGLSVATNVGITT